MARSVRVEAAAKVNLHLRVYGRREDGYHGILSLFQAVSLSDSLVIRSLKESDTIKIEGDFDCPVESTTVYRAAEAYRARTGDRTGLNISVTKRIPAGAGLGGGSSDAAATLAGLEAVLGAGVDSRAMAELGAAIGSDVPFFLGPGAAVVSGRGEIVEPIEARVDLSLVLAFPGFPVSTCEAYALLDDRRPDDSGEGDPGPVDIEVAYRGRPGEWPFANSFEPVIGAEHPRILDAKAAFLDAGAAFASMSGSGSSAFGVFEGGGEGRALGKLRDAGFRAWAASPLARCLTLY
jgi:4-diphosphocytidyl-2-C-methyl-D-erythritol kinase